MVRDAQGLRVTTDSPLAVQFIDQFIDQALGYGKNALSSIQQALQADPTCVLAHAYAAAHLLSQETATAAQQAQVHLRAMKLGMERVTERERWYAQGITAWATGNISQAIALQEAITDQYPQDLMAVQQGQYHYFYQGQFPALLHIAEKVLPANPANHYLEGMVAFGWEQCGDYAKAEAIARRAVVRNRQDAWAHHAIAHVLHQRGRFQEGIAWMESHTDTWEQCNSMLYTHNWWHIALYYLALGEMQTVLRLYDRHIWGRANHSSPKDQVGAIATLIRLELQGVDVGDRWLALLPCLRPRLHEHALAFQDLHYIYALARTGQMAWVSEMFRSLHQHSKKLPPAQQPTWTEIVIPAAKGLVTYALGDYLTAASILNAVLPRLFTIGGSRTQHELFTQIAQRAFTKVEHVSTFTGMSSRAERTGVSHLLAA